jgi:tripartite-type tricarboxylate transporter receptor subunit TctC
LTIVPGTPEEFQAYVQSEAARWRDLIKAENIQVQ